MLQDIKFGLKLLWKERAFSFAALLTLALCIGANTAIFTVLHTVVLRALPYRDAGELVTMYNIYPGVGVIDRGSNGVPDYLDRRKMTDVFSDVALFGSAGYDVGLEGSPHRIEGEYVTPSFFKILGVQPVRGRTFTDEEATIGKEKVAILSEGLWKELFASSSDVIGKDIRLSGVPYRVVGVMPNSFAHVGRESRVWVPFAFRPEQTSDEMRHANNWDMNSIAAYLIAHLFEEFIFSSYRINLGDNFFAVLGTGLQPLLLGATVLLAYWLILLWMYRRKLFLKI